MIASLRGTLVEKSPSRLIVEANGVGYDIQVPLSTFYVVGDAGVSVSLRIHTHVREDVIALYGFATKLEQQLFEKLISISGVGPKLALSVLSGIEPAELIRAVRTQDIVRLTAIPGVGKKTAERIGLELKDRLPAALQAAGQAQIESTPGDSVRDDILSALLNLGYQRAAAEKAIEQTLGQSRDLPFDAALKDVLRRLMVHR